MNESVQEQTLAWLTTPLVDGYIHDWLVAGPLATPVHNLDAYPGPDFKLAIAKDRYRTDPGVADPPAERASFRPYDGETELMWRIWRAEDDHFVDLSRFHHTCHHLQSWAFCALESPSAGPISAVLTTNGPADVWVNGAHVHRVEHFHHQLPGHARFSLPLQAGRNQVLVRFEGVAVRECPYVMALGLEEASGDLQVALATTLQPAERRQALEELFAQAYLDRDVFTRNENITVHWPAGRPAHDNFAARLQRHDGRIYSEHLTEGKRRDQIVLGVAYQFPEDVYQVLLFPHPEEYYVKNMRVERRLDLRIVTNRFSHEPYGTYAERRREALLDAARRPVNVFSEIAKMELGYWKDVDPAAVQRTIDSINQRADCSDFYLVGLLGMMDRYMDEPDFPDALRQPLRECVLNFRYWMDEPGNDAMCFWSENHQILFHACEVLAGQLFPEERFTNAGMTGAEHRRKGEEMALSWLRKRALGGFREWDSNTYFEEDVLALSHLADLAESDELAELATVVLDKMFFGLAVNSFKGIFGSTHGRTYTPFIKGAYLEPTSGISRLLWGMGIFNDRILGTVSLACSGYELPLPIAAVATDQAPEVWNRERHAGRMELWCDRAEGHWEVNKVTYKTPDYMLASAQDYLPGMYGYQQHIWQATLSPDAVVFVTHPPCVSEDGSHRPNFWHGNVVLPRVAQWKDVLVAVHNLPENDWMGFTHAYFPTYAFDEWSLEGDWACARVGDGYLALTAAQGLRLVERGKNAFRELRSYGRQNVWLVHMGRAAVDGGFDDFRAKVQTLDVHFEPLAVHAGTLRGQSIDFGWEGPLLVDEREQPLRFVLHYDNPYTQTELGAETMEIGAGDMLMRLRFGK